MKRLFLVLSVLPIFCLCEYLCLAAVQAKKEVKRGNLLYNKGQFAEALKKYEEALLDVPESDIVNFNLGAALYKIEDYQAAIGHFEKSLVSEQESLEQKASYNIGNAKYKFGAGFEETDLLKAIGLLKESLRHYECALELVPEDEDTKYNYEFVKKELERLQQKLEKQQQEQKQQRQQEKGESEEKKEQRKMTRMQEEQKEQQERETEQKQSQQPGQGKEEKEQAESVSPEQQRETEEGQASRQSTQADESEEMSEQEALMLLENYNQEEEPKGLYKEKMPTADLTDVLKDW